MLNRTETERAVASPKRAGLVLSVLVALALIVTIGAAEALACTCGLRRTGVSCRDLAEAQAIFAGEVISIEPVTVEARGRRIIAERRVTLRVLEAFDGHVGAEVQILTNADSSMCGYSFNKGSRYLVYAFARPDGELTTSICSRTKPLANIGGELSFLRAPATLKATHVTGRVQLRENDYGTGSLSPRPVAGARFVLSGDRQYEAVSGRDGEFEIDVPSGKYAVHFLVADDLYVGALPRLPRELDLSDTRACPHVEAAAHHDGRVSGRLLTGDGRPAADVAIEIVRADRRTAAFGGRTNARGEFDLRQVAPGKYSVRLVSDPRVWLPTPAPSDDPIELRLDPGQRRALGDLVLPAGTRIARLSGRVVDSDDRPIAAAQVVVRGAADRALDAVAPFITDAAGNFSAAVVANGAPYRVIVLVEDARGWDATSTHSITDVATSEAGTPIVLRPRK